jgi:hypothetical protein
LIGDDENKMSQKQYLKTLEKEIQKINKRIDDKIMKGEQYWKEARDHKLMLRKIRFMERQNFFRRLFPTFMPFS